MSRKGENIYKRKDGRWEARYIINRTYDGKAIYKSIYAPSYSEVKKKRTNELLKLAKINTVDSSNECTLESVSLLWFKNNSHKWKKSTQCRYRDKLRIYIIPYLGKKKLSEIKTVEVEQFLSMIQTEGLPKSKPVGAGTAKSILSILKQIRIYALKSDYYVNFDLDSINIKLRKPAINVFSVMEEKTILAKLKEDLNETSLGIILCLFTGIRVGELCALKYDNVNINDGVIYIRKTMQRLPSIDSNSKTEIIIDSPKSESSIRDIPINKDISKLLKAFYRPGAFVLTGDQNKFVEPKTMENRFKRILKQCGIHPTGVHCCRHTFACRCIERGMDPKTLSEILGHANASTTLNTYVHSNFKRKEDGINQLSDLLTV